MRMRKAVLWNLGSGVSSMSLPRCRGLTMFPGVFLPPQGGALLGGVNALHSSFPENPRAQYQRQCELILEKLELQNLLSDELRRLER